ncbi:uncharacterized protein LOC106459184 [Limulus polyphemus]|uniref:Uncharacterized protein LOC106459184 n=1 Tax=Limulus polyphemus TaxID=6850 RepID=A0ABM1B3T0_LIMPO|nr:uncharacterized protein LOC106459184 [Limulus polyphemus]
MAAKGLFLKYYPHPSPLRNKRFFPSFIGLPHDEEVDEDYFVINPLLMSVYPKIHWCFLGEITHLEFFIRPRAYCKDRVERGNIHVAFHPESGSFDFNDLKVGRVLCIRYAESHTFLDLSYGIRVEHLDFVMVIKGSFSTLIKISDFDPQRKTSQCWACTGQNELKSCKGCKVAKYCSKECQALDWLSRHKTWCPALPGYQKLLDIDYTQYEYPFHKTFSRN